MEHRRVPWLHKAFILPPSVALAMVAAEIYSLSPFNLLSLFRYPSLLRNLYQLRILRSLVSPFIRLFNLNNKTFALLYTVNWILTFTIPPFINMHKYLRVTLALSCLGSLIAFPFPTEEFRVRSLLTGRALTPDNTCGNVQNGENKGYSCDPTIENGGGCCSSSGFCG